MRPIFFLLVTFTLYSCGSKSLHDTKPDKVISVDVNEKLKVKKVTDLIRSYKIISLETKNDNLLGTISKMYFNKNRIYIFDNLTKGVYIFDKQGKFLNKIQAFGKGPREYLKLSDFCLNSFTGNLILVDPASRKLIQHDLDGNFQKETYFETLYFSKIESVGSDGYLLYNDYQGSKGGKDNFNIFKLSRQLEVQEKYFSYNFEDRAHFSKLQYFKTSFPDSPLYLPLTSPSIYSYNKGKLTLKYEIKFNREFAEPKELALYGKKNDLDKIQGISSFYETDSLYFLSYYFKSLSWSIFINKFNNHRVSYHEFLYDFPCPWGGTFSGVYDGKFALWSHASALTRNLKAYKNSSEYKFTQKYEEFFKYSNLPDASNPVIVLYEINSSF